MIHLLGRRLSQEMRSSLELAKLSKRGSLHFCKGSGEPRVSEALRALSPLWPKSPRYLRTGRHFDAVKCQYNIHIDVKSHDLWITKAHRGESGPRRLAMNCREFPLVHPLVSVELEHRAASCMGAGVERRVGVTVLERRGSEAPTRSAAKKK